ncbi:hypothetical protein [Sphingomonas sp. AP4-R1]|uniref:hypothetical protein n=1 Tax=Sphingomonas sp. AP4-R1 TaxID=2735134 RepID=UPI0020A57F87|nr:hypothetical protein [Sphingomonas sp. AP4-R1]
MPRRLSPSPTRFAGWPVWPARLLLAALALSIVWGLAHPPLRDPTGQPGGGDAALYRLVAERVAHGQPYHQAAAEEQRGGGYPLHPFSAMRQPLLAEIGATLGPKGADLALCLLGVAASVAGVMRLGAGLRSPVREVAILLAATASGLLLQPGMWVWHEAWAGLLIALALAVRSERLWWPAVVLGLIAALIRELAFPVLPIMALMAWHDRRRTEAVAWVAAAVCAIGALAWHAALVASVVQPDDGVSPGWLVLGGWRFDLTLARQSALLVFLPPRGAAVALPLAMLGWAGWRSGYALRVTLMLSVWLSAFLFVGRPDNGYWGFLLAPLLPIGLALAPAALRDLACSAAPLALRRLSGETGAHSSPSASADVHSIRSLDPRTGPDAGHDRTVRGGPAPRRLHFLRAFQLRL